MTEQGRPCLRASVGQPFIVGIKPSLGLVPGSGVVPACGSLDCVSVFALTASDASAALQIVAGPDDADDFSRPIPLGEMGALPSALRGGIPRREDRHFFGDADAQSAFEAAVGQMSAIGGAPSEIDLTVFFDAAQLLYHGPWVAERTAAIWDFIERHPETVHPITRTIIAEGVEKSAVETFRAIYRLRELARQAGAGRRKSIPCPQPHPRDGIRRSRWRIGDYLGHRRRTFQHRSGQFLRRLLRN